MKTFTDGLCAPDSARVMKKFALALAGIVAALNQVAKVRARSRELRTAVVRYAEWTSGCAIFTTEGDFVDGGVSQSGRRMGCESPSADGTLTRTSSAFSC